MAITLGQLRYFVGASDNGLRRVLDSSRRQLDNFHGFVRQGRDTLDRYNRTLDQGVAKLRNWGLAVGAAIGAAGFGFNAILDRASDAEETLAKFRAVFQDQTDDVSQWVDNVAESLGRSRTELREWVAELQDTFVPLGFARDRAAELSTSLIDISLDVAAFNNKMDSEVVRNFTSAIVGNHEAVRSYGIVITEAALKQELMRQGIDRSFHELDETTKAQLRYNIIVRSSGDAMGYAAREAEGYANRKRALGSVVREVQETLGALYLPTANKVLGSLIDTGNRVRDWIAENRQLILQVSVLGGGLVALATAIGGTALGIIVFLRGIRLLSSAVLLFTNPLTLLIATLGLLWLAWDQNWGGMQDKVQGVWQAISPILKSIQDWEAKTISTVWNWTVTGLNWISEEFIPWLENLPTTIYHWLEWVVVGLDDLREATALAVERTVNWFVNLLRGTWDEVKDWIDRVVTWAVRLTKGTSEQVADWISRAVTWAVDLTKGAAEQVVDWVDRVVTWAVRLAKGTAEQVSDWVSRTVIWLVNLSKGLSESVTDWVDRQVTWFVNLAQGLIGTVADWIGQRLDWFVDLNKGAIERVVDWITRRITWFVDLSKGVAAAVTDWVNRNVDWFVDLAKGTATQVADWIGRVVTWFVDLTKGTLVAVADWIDRNIDWVVDLAKGTATQVADWINRNVDWFVDLVKGTSGQVADWVSRRVDWFVDLVKGIPDQVSDWIDRAVTWIVNLTKGVATQVADWVNRNVDWFVDLAKGIPDRVADWVDRVVTWAVDLAQGSAERVAGWVSRVVEWTVHLAHVTADSANAVAQWFLGAIEGSSEARKITTDVDLVLEEAPPGWGDRLEAWLRRQTEALSWQEITEEEFTRLQEELGDQASRILKAEDGRFFQATPERLEMAANFFLNLGNTIAGYVVGRTIFASLALAVDGLFSLLGWTWGLIATGVTGWILPIAGLTAALTVSMVVAFNLLPEETQASISEFLDTFFKNDLEGYIKGALGALAALLLGVAAGAGGVLITLAGLLAFAIGNIDWDLVGVKVASLWDRFREWYRNKESEFGWEPGEHGVLTFGVQLLFQVLGIDFDLSDQAESTLDKLGKVAENVPVLRDLVRIVRGLQGLGGTSDSGEVQDQVVSEVEGVADALQTAQQNADQAKDSFEELQQTWTKLNNAQKVFIEAIRQGATPEAAAAITSIAFWETRGFGGFTHTDPNTGEVIRGSSGEVGMMQIMPDTGRDIWERILGIQEPFNEEVLENLDANISLGVTYFLEQYRRYSGDVDKAISAYNAGRAVDHNQEYVTGTKQFWISDPTVQEMLDAVREGGGNTGQAWIDGLLAKLPEAEEAALELANAVAQYLVGESPPPEGPLSEIDRGGANTIIAWFDGIRGEIDAQGGGLTNTLRVLVDRIYNGLIAITKDRYPEFAKFLEDLQSDMKESLDATDSEFNQTTGNMETKMKQVQAVAKQWTDNLVAGIADAIVAGKELTDVFNNFLQTLASQFLQTRILGPIFNAVLPGVITGLPIFHAGGLVMAGQGISVMHSGGIIEGLGPDEVPIIAQTRERVLSRDQNDRFERMLEEGKDVHHHYYIEAVDSKSFFDLIARNPEAVKMVTLQDIASNGDIRKAIKSIK